LPGAVSDEGCNGRFWQWQTFRSENRIALGRVAQLNAERTFCLDHKERVVQIDRIADRIGSGFGGSWIFSGISRCGAFLGGNLAADERNAHFLPAAETALRNIVLDLSASASEQREPAPEQPAAENFRITDEHLGEGSAKAKFSANIEAISVLKMVESEHRSALPQEQEVLSRYVGWGGLPQAFDEHSEAWRSEYSALKSLLTQEEYEAARASTLNAHYTSPLVIRAIYAAVEQLGFRSGNVLEPSCGVGNFFGMLPESMRESRLYGVELDSITGTHCPAAVFQGAQSPLQALKRLTAGISLTLPSAMCRLGRIRCRTKTLPATIF